MKALGPAGYRYICVDADMAACMNRLEGSVFAPVCSTFCCSNPAFCGAKAQPNFPILDSQCSSSCGSVCSPRPPPPHTPPLSCPSPSPLPPLVPDGWLSLAPPSPHVLCGEPQNSDARSSDLQWFTSQHGSRPIGDLHDVNPQSGYLQISNAPSPYGQRVNLLNVNMPREEAYGVNLQAGSFEEGAALPSGKRLCHGPSTSCSFAVTAVTAGGGLSNDSMKEVLFDANRRGFCGGLAKELISVEEKAQGFCNDLRKAVEGMPTGCCDSRIELPSYGAQQTELLNDMSKEMMSFGKKTIEPLNSFRNNSSFGKEMLFEEKQREPYIDFRNGTAFLKEMSLGEKQREPCSLDSLPTEYLVNICRYLTVPKDLAAISATCIRLNKVSSMAKKELKLSSNPGHLMFRSLLIRFNNITSLDLPFRLGGTPFTDLSLKTLATVKPPLVSIRLEKQSSISDEGLLSLAMAFTKLEEISLSGCIYITDTGLCAIASSCPKLKTLRICYCRSVTSVGLAAVTSSCPSLSTLDISQISGFLGICPQLKDLTINCDACDCGDNIEAVSVNCPQLSVFSLRFCCKIGERFDSIRTKSKFLSKMILDSCTDLPPQLFAFGWPTLTELHIRTSAVDDLTLEAIAKGCGNLREVRLLSCAHITDEGVVKIASSCTMLEILDVGQCPRVTHSELVACAVGLSPALLQIGLPRQCFGAKHLKAVSRHGWSLDTSSAQWLLVRNIPCSCSSCTFRRTQHERRVSFLSWEGMQSWKP